MSRKLRAFAAAVLATAHARPAGVCYRPRARALGGALVLMMAACVACVDRGVASSNPTADAATGTVADAATDSATTTGSGPDATDTTPAVEVDPVTDPATILPAAFVGELPRAADGRPVLFDLGDPLDHVQLVWDPTQDDAVMRFGHCLEIAMPCADPDEAKAAACIHALPRCASAEGGVGCCPGPCIDRFDAAIASGAKVEAALDVSLLSNCVPGVSP